MPLSTQGDSRDLIVPLSTQGHVPIIEALVKAGANPNQVIVKALCDVNDAL